MFAPGFHRHNRLGYVAVGLFCLSDPCMNAKSAPARASYVLIPETVRLQSENSVQVIEGSRVFSAALSRKGEVNRYKLNLVQGSIFSVNVRAANEGLFPIVRLRSDSGVLLKKPVAFNKSSAQLGLFKLLSGKGILEVFSQGGRAGLYSIEVSVIDRQHFKNQIVEMTNAARIRAGLQPLIRNALLDQAAESHVRDMDQQDTYLAHTGSNGSTPQERIKRSGYKSAWINLDGRSRRTIRLENAATGWTSPSDVVQGWLASPGHHAAMMDPYTKEIGVAFEYDNESATTYWVQNFGYPWRPGLVEF